MHMTRVTPVWIWECTGSFLEVLVQRHLVKWTYESCEHMYTNHTAVKYFFLKMIFKNDGKIVKSVKYTAHKI